MPVDLRAAFPVLERIAYLNTGTDGPIPRVAAEAAAAATERELRDGRAGPRHREWANALGDAVRAEVAALLSAVPEEVALTRSTTDGVNTVLGGLALGPGDEVLTSDEEHPGVLAPVAAAQRRQGFTIRRAPFAELTEHAGPRTRLVACSHVSWVSGLPVDLAPLAASGSDALVLLDGAQGLGAVAVDPRALGCDFYAASGQKWLCGPDGTGYLWVHPDRLEELAVPWPSYISLDEPQRAAELPVHPGARRFDMGVFEAGELAWALASLRLLAEAGWDAVYERGAALSATLAQRLAEAGHDVLLRGETTLVAWRAEDPAGAVARLAEAGVVVRDLPGRGLLRASVGAWSSEDDLERLLAGLGAPAARAA